MLRTGATRHWYGDGDQGDVWQLKKAVKNDLHPTMKPVELVERAIRNSVRPGDTVLDCFAGSGTTMIAAEKAGRLARLIERDPKYCDVIVRRREGFSGGSATRESDGVTFADLTSEAVGVRQRLGCRCAANKEIFSAPTAVNILPLRAMPVTISA